MSVDVTLTEDSVTVIDEARGINFFAKGKLPDGSMKWIVVVILAIFLGAENIGLLGTI